MVYIAKKKGLHYGGPTYYLPQLGHLVFGIGRGVCFSEYILS